MKSESKSFQAATVCFNEALDLLSKSNEGEKIKKDFTAILHVSTNTFYKNKDCQNYRNASRSLVERQMRRHRKPLLCQVRVFLLGKCLTKWFQAH